MTEEKLVVMTKDKTSLIKDNDMPKSITSKKLNGLNYLALAHVVKVFFFLTWKKRNEIFDR